MGRAKHNYMREINSLGPLKTQDLGALAAKMLDGSAEARELIVLSQLPQVVQIARDFADMGLEEEELIAEGNCGLLQAVDNYQSALGDFEAYARECIKVAIKTALELQAERIKERQILVNKINSIIEAIQTLTKAWDRVPTEAEIAEYLKINLEELQYFMKLAGYLQEEEKEREED